MTRNLKTYVTNKKNPVSTSKKSAENYAPCYLCENQELPNLKKIISGTGGKTCEDVHMELLSMQQVKNAAICSTRQDLYQKTCCPNGFGLSKPSKTAFMTVFGVFVFWMVVKNLRGRKRCRRVVSPGRLSHGDDDDDKDYEASKKYKHMDEEAEKARDVVGSRSRSRSRSRSKKASRRRSKEPKPEKHQMIEEADLSSVNAVLAAEQPIHPTQTQVV
jgi:hypothetical protein